MEVTAGNACVINPPAEKQCEYRASIHSDTVLITSQLPGSEKLVRKVPMHVRDDGKVIIRGENYTKLNPESCKITSSSVNGFCVIMQCMDPSWSQYNTDLFILDPDEALWDCGQYFNPIIVSQFSDGRYCNLACLPVESTHYLTRPAHWIPFFQ